MAKIDFTLGDEAGVKISDELLEDEDDDEEGPGLPGHSQGLAAPS